ncbi:DUF4827 family protein [Microbacter margulisiae]|uniref:Peptidylprolyl isomerase n=1 Tax=Microbacter margulisiae TaxID=1350067 RepID=A0A7W5H1E1_9PORP|nr:DUF4827 family protein [Microbacter margulisiae]MBB3186276.1 hypothetical protein [Microbacter margulisiae]
MKRIPVFILSSFSFLLLLTSCTSSGTYANLLKAQDVTIKNYVKQNGIQTVGTLPAFDKWTSSKEYYVSSTGLYYHLNVCGDTTTDSIRAGDEVSVRYLKISITTPPDTVENSWTTLDSPYPYMMIYRVSGSEPPAWQEAISYMKYSGAQATLIVPGGIGFSAEQTSIIPYIHVISILKIPGQN